MESKGEGKYDDDDDDAKSGSTRDAKSEAKEQDEQDDALLRHVFDWYYEKIWKRSSRSSPLIMREFDDECSTSESIPWNTRVHREFKYFRATIEECVEGTARPNDYGRGGPSAYQPRGTVRGGNQQRLRIVLRAHEDAAATLWGVRCCGTWTPKVACGRPVPFCGGYNVLQSYGGRGGAFGLLPDTLCALQVQVACGFAKKFARAPPTTSAIAEALRKQEYTAATAESDQIDRYSRSSDTDKPDTCSCASKP